MTSDRGDGPCRILVLWSHQLSGEALCSALESAGGGEYVVSYHPCAGLQELPPEPRPHVVLVGCSDDLQPDVATLVTLFPQAKLLLVSRGASVARRAAWLRSGVHGVIEEGQNGPGLAGVKGAIHAVLSGMVWASRRVLSHLVIHSHRRQISSDPHGLTPREGEILALLREGLRNSEIAERGGVSERTVKSHLTAIYSKLGVRGRMEAILKRSEG